VRRAGCPQAHNDQPCVPVACNLCYLFSRIPIGNQPFGLPRGRRGSHDRFDGLIGARAPLRVDVQSILPSCKRKARWLDNVRDERRHA
jgi:hypothetical protein